MNEEERFIEEVERWDSGNSTFSIEKLTLWGKEIFSLGKGFSREFVNSYDYILELTQ